MAQSKYNATVYQVRNGKVVSAFMAQVNEEGKLLRSNWLQCTGLEGTPAYDERIRSLVAESLSIVHDNGEGYKNCLRGLMLPPSYTV